VRPLPALTLSSCARPYATLEFVESAVLSAPIAPGRLPSAERPLACCALPRMAIE